MNLSAESPLSGKRVVITRASHQAAPLVKELERQGAIVISIPTIEIQPPHSFQPLDKALAKVQKYDWLLLTSVKGVEALQRRLAKAGMPASALRHLSIAAIGPGTRAAAEALGLKVAVMPAKYIAESVVEELKGGIRGKQVLLVRAKVARDVIPRELSRCGGGGSGCLSDRCASQFFRTIAGESSGWATEIRLYYFHQFVYGAKFLRHPAFWQQPQSYLGRGHHRLDWPRHLRNAYRDRPPAGRRSD
jgi:hypothetical protein